jgi:hypothetical protein
MKLSSLQHDFQGYLLDGRTEVETHIDGRRVDPRQRLKIYYDAYRSRLVEAMSSDYEAVRAVMGLEAFEVACREYVEATPSVHRNVRWYGERFPSFLQQTSPWSERPELCELARFEWSITLAFDAEDAQTVAFDDLARLPPSSWPVLGFILHPSVQTLELKSNAPAQRKAMDAAEALPPLNWSDIPIPWLLWRKDLVVCFRSIDPSEYWALQAIADGANFTSLCEGLCEWFAADEAATAAARLLRRWVDDGLIADLAT